MTRLLSCERCSRVAECHYRNRSWLCFVCTDWSGIIERAILRLAETRPDHDPYVEEVLALLRAVAREHEALVDTGRRRAAA